MTDVLFRPRHWFWNGMPASQKISLQSVLRCVNRADLKNSPRYHKITICASATVFIFPGERRLKYVLRHLDSYYSAPTSRWLRKAFSLRHQKHTLSNGLTVITVPMPSRTHFIFTVVRTGSRDEFESASRASPTSSSNDVRGTKKYPGRLRFYRDKSRRSGKCHDTDDYTMYHLTFARKI